MSRMRVVLLGLAISLVAGPAGIALGQPPTPAAPPAAPGARADGGTRSAELALIGVIVSEGGESIAIIEDRLAQKTGMFRIGAVVGGGRIKEILSDRVTLVFGDGEVELRLAGAPGGASPPPSTPPAPQPAVVNPEPPQPPGTSEPPAPEGAKFQRVDRATLEQLLGTQDLVTEVTPVQGRGVRVAAVKQGGLFQRLGLVKGDVIRSINGRPVAQSAPLSQAVEQAAQAGVIRVELERGGRMDVRYLQVAP